MTLVTIHAVVNVPAHALMLLICVAFRVAIRALKHRVVTWVGVARCTDTRSTAMVDVIPRMVKHRARPPGHHLVARLASRGKTRHDVIGIIRTLIFHPVTRIAIGGNGSVVVIDVAAGTHDLDVCPNQRKDRVVVVERCRLPRRCAVANLALLRKTAGYVIRIRRTLVILHVAADAGRVGQTIVAIDVAIATLHLQMKSRQRKAAFGMVERRRLPGDSTVTRGAIRRETRHYVIRIGGFLEILHVAART